MRKMAFCICENKGAEQLLISAFAFATWVVQFPFFLQLKFQASGQSAVAVQPSSCWARVETPRTVFLASRLICFCLSVHNKDGLPNVFVACTDAGSLMQDKSIMYLN